MRWSDICEGRYQDFERDMRPARIPDTPENIAAAKAFVMNKWIERWHERNRNADMWRKLAATGDRPDITPDYYEPPVDLTNACKFTSLFAREVFGGQLEGNWNHQYVRTEDGDIIDLNIDAADVRSLGKRAHEHDRSFWGKPDHRDSIESVRSRVADWVNEFLAAHQTAKK